MPINSPESMNLNPSSIGQDSFRDFSYNIREY